MRRAHARGILPHELCNSQCPGDICGDAFVIERSRIEYRPEVVRLRPQPLLLWSYGTKMYVVRWFRHLLSSPSFEPEALFYRLLGQSRVTDGQMGSE